MGTMTCDLVVWTFKGLVIVHLELDQNFIASIHHQLTNFFNNHFRPALLKKQLYKDSHMFLSVQELYKYFYYFLQHYCELYLRTGLICFIVV